MLLRFNTTPETMLSSRLLSATGFRFHQAVERLSSGLRVNSAADDASGLSLGTKLQAQTRGWQVAQKNVQDGLSLANVADGALGTLGDAVSRIRELAVRSANGVFTDADRALMQDEVVAVRQNIDQIVKGTQFNGTLLLAGQEFRPPPTVDVSDPALGAIAASARGTDDTETGSYALTLIAPGTPAIVTGNAAVTALPGAGTVATMTIVGPLGTKTIALDGGTTGTDWVDAINLDPTVGPAIGVTASLDPSIYGGMGALVLTSNGAGGGQSISVYVTRVDPTIDAEDAVGFGASAVQGTGGNPQVDLGLGVPAVVTSSATTMTITARGPGGQLGVTFQVDLTTPAGPPSGPAWTQAGAAAGFVGNVNVLAYPKQTGDLQLGIQSGPDSPQQQPLDIPAMTIGAMSTSALAPIRSGVVESDTVSGALGFAVAAGDTVTFTYGGITFTTAALGTAYAQDSAGSMAGLAADLQTAMNAAITASGGATPADITVTPIAGRTLGEAYFQFDGSQALAFSGASSTNTGLADALNDHSTDHIGAVDITTADGALAGIDVADAALAQINGARTKVGAEMNRLEHSLTVTANGGLEAGNSTSRVMDADMAQEAAALAQAQLLTETGVAAAAHVQLEAAAGLALITDSRIAVGSGSPVVPVAALEEAASAASASSGGSGAAPSGGAVSSASPATSFESGGPSLPGSGGFTPLPVAGSSALPGVSLPGSGGFSPTAILPSGFAPLPVAGSGGQTAGSILGLGDMQSMLQAALQ